MNNTCICCGEITPEGRQVCPTCENQIEEMAQTMANCRKQIEAEWVTVGNGITERVVCSNCKSEKGSFMRPPFCNQCGTHMKGGAE